MAPLSQADPFVGTWELQPDRTVYELGQPPAGGLYGISIEGDGYLFSVEWETADGQRYETSFSGIPDDQPVAYDNPAVADALSLTRVDELTLDSESFKGGKRIAYARRKLLAGGRTMRVTQSGQTPDGSSFSNVSFYKKID